MAPDFLISPGSSSPIFKQIVDQVRLAVATGKLAAGDQLPSVRALAERLLVNPNTIAKAYGELAHEGIIDSQQGRGAFVAPPRQVYTRSERQRRLEPLVDAMIHEGISLGFSREEMVDVLESRLDKLRLPVGTQAGRTS